MDKDKVFEDEMELLELSFRSSKSLKVNNDWDHWYEAEEWLYELRKKRLDKLRKDDLNERR